MPRTSFLPTSSPSTNSGRLSHHMVSLRLGSDVPGKTQNTWKLPDISSLHNVSKTGTFIAFDEGANLYFSRRQFALTRQGRSVRAPNDWRRATALYCCHTRPWIRSPIQDDSPSRLVARPVRSLVRRQDKTNGGAERDRTADPLLAKQVLSQLSYSPIQLDHPSLSTRRGNNSHRPTVSTQTLIRICKWWAREDLNFRPHAYQACALTN